VWISSSASSAAQARRHGGASFVRFWGQYIVRGGKSPPSALGNPATGGCGHKIFAEMKK